MLRSEGDDVVGVLVIVLVILLIGVPVAMDRSARRHRWKGRDSGEMLRARRDLRDDLRATPEHGVPASDATSWGRRGSGPYNGD